MRPDGAIEVDARYTVRTADGAHVLIHASGVRSGAPDVLEALLRGDAVDPSAYYFRTVITLEASGARLAALQNSIFVASAVRAADRVTYTAYRVT